jgi:hypothetical protein
MELQLHMSHLDTSTTHLMASFQLTQAVFTIDFKGSNHQSEFDIQRTMRRDIFLYEGRASQTGIFEFIK